MTTYKGRKALDALMDGETLFRVQEPNTLFKMCGLKLKIKDIQQVETGWHTYHAELNWLIGQTFEKYKPLPKVGEWVEATYVDEVYKGKVTRVEKNKVFALWDEYEDETYLNGDNYKFRVLTEEEVDKHELNMSFKRAGRPKNTYEVGDIVKYHKRFAEVVGEYRRDLYGGMYQMLAIQFVVDDRDGNEQMMQREVNADEVTPKCFNTNVVKLRKEEETKW